MNINTNFEIVSGGSEGEEQIKSSAAAYQKGGQRNKSFKINVLSQINSRPPCSLTANSPHLNMSTSTSCNLNKATVKRYTQRNHFQQRHANEADENYQFNAF